MRRTTKDKTTHTTKKVGKHKVKRSQNHNRRSSTTSAHESMHSCHQPPSLIAALQSDWPSYRKSWLLLIIS
ncbi:hypothetical protein L484_015348 [Morus notabilis]|uniref:Uncharacterized protein n=1 Tax=Morus notabilis TaxID=981085 RepID=W9RC96_9ROSA|nr:hypothetical protein L484_015348 [Morus notabilis]